LGVVRVWVRGRVVRRKGVYVSYEAVTVLSSRPPWKVVAAQLGEYKGVGKLPMRSGWSLIAESRDVIKPT